MKKRTVSWFSCGAASAVATKLALAEHDPDQGEFVIAYTEVVEEHPDNKRFLKDCEKWFGQDIVILGNDYYKRSIYNVFEANYMRTPAGSPCTRALKQRVRKKFEQDTDVQVFGYTVEEENRLVTFSKNNPEVNVWPILIEKGVTKGECLGILERVGIELPDLYKLGYDHNNCLGCVKGGMGYWNKIRVDFPEVFDKMAKFERRKGYTVLKEKGGEPIYLDTLNPSRGNMKKEPQIQCGIVCMNDFEEK